MFFIHFIIRIHKVSLNFNYGVGEPASLLRIKAEQGTGAT